MRRRLAFVLVVVCLAYPAGRAQPAQPIQQPQTPQRPVFQAGTDTVVLDIAVRRNGEPVLGLTQADFVITDNGVRQTIDHMTAETFPLDLTLVIDQSGYGQGVIDQIKGAAAAAADLLGDDDHVRVITFNANVHTLYDGVPVGAADAIAPIESAGRTSLYDALVLSLMRKRAPDRRSLVVAFTLGVDSTSTTSPAKLKDVSRRADVILDMFLAYRPENPLAGRAVQYDDNIKDAAEATGGFLEEMLGTDEVTKKLRTALLDFRARYMLSYTISGAARHGWHDVSVKVLKPADCQVLVRKGYDGGR